VAFLLGDHANGDPWNQILVVYNGSRQAQVLAVPGKWTIVANAERAGTKALEHVTNEVRVEACSLLIAHNGGASPSE
jgi:pullulanase